MAHEVVLIPGDGIGPEITSAMRRVVDATGVAIEWDVRDAGAGVMEAYGTPLPQHVLDAVGRAKVAIKGPITTPIGTGFRSVNVALRKHFDLYACVRPCLSQPGDGSRYEGVDIVIVRENTEDLYAGIEFDEGAAEVAALSELVSASGQKAFRPDSAISVKPISIEGSRRIVEYAFEYARRCGRRKVTAVHKANIMKATDGLFLRVAREVAQRYPDIAFEDKIVDATCMGLVQNPADFDVLVLPNLYGDIVSDLGAGLVGGLGMAPGFQYRRRYRRFRTYAWIGTRYRGQGHRQPHRRDPLRRHDARPRGRAGGRRANPPGGTRCPRRGDGRNRRCAPCPDGQCTGCRGNSGVRRCRYCIAARRGLR